VSPGERGGRPSLSLPLPLPFPGIELAWKSWIRGRITPGILWLGCKNRFWRKKKWLMEKNA